MKDLECDVSSVSPSSEQTQELLGVVVYMRVFRGALPLVEIRSHEFVNKLVE